MMPFTLRSIVITIAVATIVGPAGAAVDIPKEGRLDFNYCMAGKADYTELRSGLAIGQFESWAGTYANGVTKAFDRMGSRCVGAYEIVEGKYRDYGVCTMADTDGDKWLMHFETGADLNGKWVALGGSGKYEGITASASYGPIGEIPPPAAPGAYNKCNRNTGTYRLR